MSPPSMPQVATAASPPMVNNPPYMNDPFNPPWNQADIVGDPSYDILLRSTGGLDMNWGSNDVDIKPPTRMAPQAREGAQDGPTLTDGLGDFIDYYSSQPNVQPFPGGSLGSNEHPQ